jgi:cellobiose-specific phosphotransferase system component IIB
MDTDDRIRINSREYYLIEHKRLHAKKSKKFNVIKIKIYLMMNDKNVLEDHKVWR